MKLSTLCLALMLCASTYGAAVDDAARLFLSNIVAGVPVVLNTNVIPFIGISNAWLGQSRAALQISNATEVLALSETPVTVTNYTRLTIPPRACFADITNGLITVSNAGVYLLNYGASSELGTPNRTITSEIYVNNDGTGIRMQQNPSVGILEVGRILGLRQLTNGDIVSVRVSSDSMTPSLTIREAGLNIIRQND